MHVLCKMFNNIININTKMNHYGRNSNNSRYFTHTYVCVYYIIVTFCSLTEPNKLSLLSVG